MRFQILIDSAFPPGSSDRTEIDRELQGVKDGSGVVKEVRKVSLQKGDPSWASMAKDKKAMTMYDVEISSRDGKNKVVFPDDIISDSTPLWEDFVVGNFLDIAPHIAKVHMVVNKIWSYGDSNAKVEVYDVDAKTMRFKIGNQRAREKVIKRGMWNIAGVPKVVKKWSPKAEEDKQEEDVIPMWVHLRKIPLNTFSWEALSFMTSTVGFPVRLHPETMSCSNFEEAKVFVKVDVSKTLPKEIDFTMGGKEFTAEFYYPWLPSRCNVCEKWGHTDKVCATKKRDNMAMVRESGGKSSGKVGSEVVEVLREKENKQEVEVQNKGQIITEADSVDTVNADMVCSGGNDGKASDWSLVSPGKIGRVQISSLREVAEVQISASKYSVLSIDEVEEGELEESQEVEGEEEDEVESTDNLEGVCLEEEILGEGNKAVKQRGGRRVKKTKAQEVQPKIKRSSRRNL